MTPGKVPGSAKRPQPKGGSRKGIPNKVTKELKDMILGALDKAGGEAYLQEQATENPKAFLSLLGRVLPMQVTGDANAPLVVKVMTVTTEAEQKAAWQKPE